MELTLKDVIVIGGGPAGLHAARRLAACGYAVDIIEEHACVGDPVHCTGIVAPEVFEEFSIPRSSVINELSCVRFYSPKGQAIQYCTARTEAVVVDRREFDCCLQELACREGARLLAGIRAVKIESTPNCLVVHCSDGKARIARACILATGASYALHRGLGIGFPPIFLNCAQGELPVKESGTVEVYFGCQVAPKGFAWVVPVDRADRFRVRIGLMCAGDAGSYFEQFLCRLNRSDTLSEPQLKVQRGIMPLAPIKKTYGNRFLVCGGAGGFVKPTTGGGVFYGMISADIAARVLSQALSRDRLQESDLAVYQQLWRGRLMEEIEAQLTLRLLMHKMSDEELESVFELCARDGLMPLIKKTALFNYYRRLAGLLIRHPAVRKILFPARDNADMVV